ncbi:MAG TPA: histidinol dehydrogenase [Candidatus Hydrogenedentes bacterium]|nr:histidinol dehydrogenase [Candidatus Hydrogenedentota bacterium]
MIQTAVGMKRYDITRESAFAEACSRITRSGADDNANADATDKLNATRSIVEAVRDRGDAAVAEFTERFDKVNLSSAQFEIGPKEIDAAMNRVERNVLSALERAHANISAFHEKNLRSSWEETSADGSVIGQRLTSIESVGLYVPGGTAFYPSSVLMNIVPARVAGVRDIVMVSPPSFEGSIHPLVLAAARIAGASRVFRVGGAQSIAALAYGTESIPQVLKIAGPGNAYVTLAKRIVSGVCDIDKEAGPSEVVVLADENADPRQVAMELLAQAEHDVDARAILVTPSAVLVEKVLEAIELELRTLPRAEIITKSLQAHGEIYVTRNLEDGEQLTNLLAPEHLSIQTGDPRSSLARIPNVGCAVLGGGTSVAVGDYYAGPNHILPTGRKARFSSPLTAEDFRKVTSIISFSPERMRAAADDIIALANAEQLQAHARAVEIRR